VLEIRVLGTLEIVRDGVVAALPPSRKTRALLAYLALMPGPHRREQLCEMLWDVPDDPRGALRWSLSKIRPLIDEPALPRLIADRNTVELRTAKGDIDFFAAQVCADDKAAATGDLARAASCFRGPLLADLDLTEQRSYGPVESGRRRVGCGR
jgi:DNA-binding SARP family transcriptional activator